MSEPTPTDRRSADPTPLRAIGGVPAASQQEQLAARLALPASRMVALIDGLETRGVIPRRRDPTTVG